jgi:16S rRNA (guanine966-N2)-methyltransferase
MANKKARPARRPARAKQPAPAASTLRIIGGELRGRQILYSGDPRTRPMKDNTREAVFNLIGAWVPGKLAIDLFAGTGALGLEALSRGADHAILVEHHVPSSKLIADNVAALGVADRATIEAADTFYFVRHFVKQTPPVEQRPWLVFCSPPYDLYLDRGEEMVAMLTALVQAAPADSIFVVESDERFPRERLPLASLWRVRHYPPAVVYVLRPGRGSDASN